MPSPDVSREIQSLPLQRRLVTSGELTVYQARAGEIPRTLQEIGRLREIAFRAAGEGSGKACDLDEFDSSYIHLFIWSHRAGELVGAYRLGPTDEILPASGLSGLYTSTLFNFAPGFQPQIGCALEMGRSFVRPEYQRTLGALPLLWKGISKFVLENPRYRILFGAVSISSRYGHFSRDLMVAFLRSHHYLSSLSGMVKARTPFRPTGQKALAQQTLELVGSNIEELSTIISDIESSGAGVPVLLKHYLKLGGRILGFNVDPNFSHVVDGLILVDLLQTQPRFLQRFMGKDQADSYRAAWLPAGVSPNLRPARTWYNDSFIGRSICHHLLRLILCRRRPLPTSWLPRNWPSTAASFRLGLKTPRPVQPQQTLHARRPRPAGLQSRNRTLMGPTPQRRVFVTV